MEINSEANNILEQQTKIPQFLKVICILTFIGSGLAIISNFFYSIFYDTILNILSQQEDDFLKKTYEALSVITREFYIANFFLSTLSLVGAIMMFKLKKIGFHFYTVANLLMLGLPIFLLHESFNFFNLMFITGPFILMYGMHLKYMK